MFLLILFYALLIIFLFWGCNFSGKGFFAEESLARNVTDSVKGFFIWLVFLSHFSSYVQYEHAIDIYGKNISVFLGQLIVACFLFYSGYGVCESIKRNGTAYVKTLPKNRILKTLLHFDICVLIFLIIQLCIGETYSLSHILLGFIGWESFGNSNWYIFVILALYLITWFSFTCIKNSLLKAGMLTTALTALLVIFLFFTRWSWWYDTTLCYLLGMFISIYKNKFLAFITRNNLVWFICFVASLGLFAILYRCPLPFHPKLVLILRLLAPPAFCLAITILLTKVKISNKMLMFSGRHLFEIYILQRIPMILFKEWGMESFNLYVYFILCVVSTIVLAIVFRNAINKMDSFVLKPQK